jgi:hypothetical protein
MKSKFFSAYGIRAFVGSLAVAFSAGSALAADSEPLASSATYDRPAIEIGGGIADDGGSGEINLLMPLVFSEGKDLLFFGADTKFSGFNINDSGDTVYNVGGYLGYRRLLDDGAGVLGLWAGVDYFNTNQSNEFARAIAGIEYFGPQVIARANGFVPFDSTSAEWSVTSGGFITTYDEKVPSGFDAELGLRMALPMESFAKPGEFRIFAGGYDFIGLADDGGNVLGGRARAELDLYLFDEHPDTRLSLEASYAYDKHSGDQYGAGLKLSIPLGVTNKVTSHGAKDDVVAELDSFGQDLFQPIRRNRSNASRVRTKSRTPVDTGTGGVGGVTLSNVCGGASGTLALNSGLGASTIKQGAQIGIIDPAGAAKPLNLTLAKMLAPDGQTLAQLLASSPQTIDTTLTFPTSTVNFATDTVEPSAAVASSGGAAADQKMVSTTVTINGNSCSINVQTETVQAAGFTMANICGGTKAAITLNPGMTATTLAQGALLGNIINFNTNTDIGDLVLDISTMVDQNGKTLAQLLANAPQTISAVLNLPANLWDPLVSRVESLSPYVTSGGVPFGCTESVTAATLTVNGSTCSMNLTRSQACSISVTASKK